VIEPILLQQQEPSPLLQAAWVFTILGVIVAAGSLVVSAIANQQSARANEVTSRAERARFWLELRKMFAEHDQVHKKLLVGGAWYKNLNDRPNQDERADVIPYLGLFEHCKLMMDQCLIDKETFIRIYRYRLTAILRNGPIKTELLKVGKEGEQRDDEEGKEPYEDFKRLVKENDFPDERLQTMLRNPRGGSVKALTSSAP
jgi:hypothetical protein